MWNKLLTIYLSRKLRIRERQSERRYIERYSRGPLYIPEFNVNIDSWQHRLWRNRREGHKDIPKTWGSVKTYLLPGACTVLYSHLHASSIDEGHSCKIRQKRIKTSVSITKRKEEIFILGAILVNFPYNITYIPVTSKFRYETHLEL